MQNYAILQDFKTWKTSTLRICQNARLFKSSRILQDFSGLLGRQDFTRLKDFAKLQDLKFLRTFQDYMFLQDCKNFAKLCKISTLYARLCHCMIIQEFARLHIPYFARMQDYARLQDFNNLLNSKILQDCKILQDYTIL